MKCWYFREWALYGIKPVPSKPSVRRYWWLSVNSVIALFHHLVFVMRTLGIDALPLPIAPFYPVVRKHIWGRYSWPATEKPVLTYYWLKWAGQLYCLVRPLKFSLVYCDDNVTFRIRGHNTRYLNKNYGTVTIIWLTCLKAQLQQFAKISEQTYKYKIIMAMPLVFQHKKPLQRPLSVLLDR